MQYTVYFDEDHQIIQLIDEHQTPVGELKYSNNALNDFGRFRIVTVKKDVSKMKYYVLLSWGQHYTFDKY
jgi:hypothetical protein